MQLFAPDNFSDPTIRFTSPASEEAQGMRAILDKYVAPGFTIDEVAQLEGTEINSNNYRVTLTTGSGPRRFLVRRCKFIARREQLASQIELLTFLHSQGVPVSTVVTTASGDDFVERDGELYVVFEFVSGEHFRPTEASFVSLARALASLHMALKHTPENLAHRLASFSTQNEKAYFNKVATYAPDDFERLLPYLQMDQSEAARLVLSVEPALIRTITEVAAAGNKLAKLPLQLIHSDIHPHNVLMRQDEVTAFVDFDSVRSSQRIRDIGAALYRFGRQFFVTGQAPATMIAEQASVLREAFLEAYTEMNPLTVDERALIPIALKDEFIRKLLFVLKGVYEEGNATWARDLPKFVTAFHEIDYFWPVA